MTTQTAISSLPSKQVCSVAPLEIGSTNPSSSPEFLMDLEAATSKLENNQETATPLANLENQFPSLLQKPESQNELLDQPIQIFEPFPQSPACFHSLNQLFRHTELPAEISTFSISLHHKPEKPEEIFTLEEKLWLKHTPNATELSALKTMVDSQEILCWMDSIYGINPQELCTSDSDFRDQKEHSASEEIKISTKILQQEMNSGAELDYEAIQLNSGSTLSVQDVPHFLSETVSVSVEQACLKYEETAANIGESVNNQIMAKVAVINAQGSSSPQKIVLQLSPQYLGSVEISCSFDIHGKLNQVNVLAESEHTHQVLKSNHHQLFGMLGAIGIDAQSLRLNFRIKEPAEAKKSDSLNSKAMASNSEYLTDGLAIPFRNVIIDLSNLRMNILA